MPSVKSKTQQSRDQLSEVLIHGEPYFQIRDIQLMRPFFMTIVSHSNHWLFMGSNGGISAGRVRPDNALFPYYTDDKIIESAENTGSKTIIRVFKKGKLHIWEPFSQRSAAQYKLQQHLYKSYYGNAVVFEEVNEDLNLLFQYQWNSSEQFGFVRQCQLKNTGKQPVKAEILDGLQNILPYGIGATLQQRSSNLADAYKRQELAEGTALAIYALSAMIVDKAAPAESLRANIVWSAGFKNSTLLLSGRQLDHFRSHGKVTAETDIKGEKGAYFTVSTEIIAPGKEKQWLMGADVAQTHSTIAALTGKLQNTKKLLLEIKADISNGTQKLRQLVNQSDGWQISADSLTDARHYSNVLFNIMRGGIFDHHYQVDKADLLQFIKNANKEVYNKWKAPLNRLPSSLNLFELRSQTAPIEDAHLQRLLTEYLPLTFSRRHGDPSRPWNAFSINTHNENTGKKMLDYEGNWRDLFQNWEALACSYPGFLEGMIFKFLNASTPDGYNPYRVTRNGFDWETIEPDDPWSYIGYWGDHQVIYLLKLLEMLEKHSPGKLQELFNSQLFVYANVPYRIKSYSDILKNPKDSIVFDHTMDVSIRKRMQSMGADGALCTNAAGNIHCVSLFEKLLLLVLTKLSNLIPGGGIWMNTQRPEWNDANNALVGNGLSVVTMAYLRRMLAFLLPKVKQTREKNTMVSAELHLFFKKINLLFQQKKSMLNESHRKKITDSLGMAASEYRQAIYKQSFSGKKISIPMDEIKDCFSKAILILDASLKLNKRSDGLYHSYNIIHLTSKHYAIQHLSTMLEGQVAILSSGVCSAEESLQLLQSLKKSELYRPDQNSYLLYPNKNLPGFLHKNVLPEASINKLKLLQLLHKNGDTSIAEKDIKGNWHFNSHFQHAGDLSEALDALGGSYKSVVKNEKPPLLQLFEDMFRHREFTGRSGTFFAYEGLGSIYWHMVSKLRLSVLETIEQATQQKAGAAIIKALKKEYDTIRDGIGVHKSPVKYGAFPTDPYSHTPLHKGAQQPGMTGQVKEDILSRWLELGITISNGVLSFHPLLIHKHEWLKQKTTISFQQVNGDNINIRIAAGAICFSYCQVPVIYQLSTANRIEIETNDGAVRVNKNTSLTEKESQALFNRTGLIKSIRVFFDANRFKI